MRTIREDYALAYRYARQYHKSQWNAPYTTYRDVCFESLITLEVLDKAWHSKVTRLDMPITNLFDRLYNRLVARYEAQIKADYADLEHNPPDVLEPSENSDNEKIGCTYLGTVFSIMPSGKYHTLWACSNVSDIEQFKDQCYSEALDNVAESFGGWIESSMDDPCDLFFCKAYED